MFIRMVRAPLVNPFLAMAEPFIPPSHALRILLLRATGVLVDFPLTDTTKREKALHPWTQAPVAVREIGRAHV